MDLEDEVWSERRKDWGKRISDLETEIAAFRVPKDYGPKIADIEELQSLMLIGSFNAGGETVSTGEIQRVSVASIANPAAELASYAGDEPGAMLVAYQVIATTDLSTIYIWDSADSGGASVPYVVAGSSGFWVAAGGMYNYRRDIQLVSVADIDDPTAELANYKGIYNGSLAIAYQAAANCSIYTIYAWDSAVAVSTGTPYCVPGSSGYWVAVGGRYADADYTVRNKIQIGGYLSIHEDTNDIVIRQKTQDKDMIFEINDGGVQQEVFRLVGADRTMQFDALSASRLATLDSNKYLSTLTKGPHITDAATTADFTGTHLIDTDAVEAAILTHSNKINQILNALETGYFLATS